MIFVPLKLFIKINKDEIMLKQALKGIKVLEFSDHVSGPYCSKLFGDLGAEVIKIEEPGIGDKSRKRGPFPDDIPHLEKSGLFLYLNMNKKGITLNVNTHKGKKIFHELVKWADILIENNPAKKIKELGFTYDKLKKINPSLIMTSITPFGHNGPHSDYNAYDLNMYYGSGVLYSALPIDNTKKPIKGPRFYSEYVSGLTASTATLCAQYARKKTGQGQYIDVSKQEALIALMRVTSVAFPNFGISEFSLASMVSGMGGLMMCKDGYIILTTAEEHQWKAFMRVMGNPDWADDPELQDIFSRSKNIHKIDPLIKKWVIKHTKEEIYHKAQAEGCPCAIVNTTEEIATSKQMKARNFFVEIEHSKAGKLKYPQAPYKFSKTPWAAVRPAPLLGEHNEEIYCDYLGYSKKELIRLFMSGVI